jgi:hypothetical protein
VFYTVPEITEMIGGTMSTRRVRRWLTRAGCTERRFGTIVVTAERLGARPVVADGERMIGVSGELIQERSGWWGVEW